MRVIACSLALLLLILGGAEARMKDSWQSGSTGRGTAPWEVTERQLVYRGGADFGWGVSGPAIQDGFVEVRFRPAEGREDQAGGGGRGWEGAKNYFIARAHAR